MPLTVRKATQDDVFLFCQAIDPMDLDELKAADPHKDFQEELLSYLSDDTLVCVDEEGYVWSYGGVSPCEEGAMVWFLTSIALRYASRRTKIEYLRLMAKCRDDTLAKHGKIFNFIWDGNENHKEFIRHLGGTFHPIYRHSEITGEPFQLFTIGGNHECVPHSQSQSL